MLNVIGLVGRKSSGKDTAGQILVEEFGYTRVAFADKVKEVCKVVFDLNNKEMNDPKLKEVPIARWPFETPRSLMQRVGTECFRTYWPEVWIELAKRAIDEIDGPVVITDVRFENELLVARSRNGINVRIDASERIGHLHDNHASETAIDNLLVQDVLKNNGSLEAFQQAVRDLVNNSEAYDA